MLVLGSFSASEPLKASPNSDEFRRFQAGDSCPWAVGAFGQLAPPQRRLKTHVSKEFWLISAYSVATR